MVVYALSFFLRQTPTQATSHKDSIKYRTIDKMSHLEKYGISLFYPNKYDCKYSINTKIEHHVAR